MVAPSRGRLQPPPDERPARALVDLVQRVRLAKLTHSDNDLAAAVATVGLLLLQRLDQEAA